MVFAFFASKLFYAKNLIFKRSIWFSDFFMTSGTFQQFNRSRINLILASMEKTELISLLAQKDTTQVTSKKEPSNKLKIDKQEQLRTNSYPNAGLLVYHKKQ
jgi:hypothetical protein